MEVKQTFVIAPGSIKVSGHFEYQDFSMAQKSPFADRYDLDAEAAKLGKKHAQALTADDPDYGVWEVFQAHEQALKQHIFKQLGRRVALHYGQYRVIPNEDARFEGIGQLVNQSEDSIALHTKQAVRMWEGNSDPKNKRRWPGVRFAMMLSNELAGYARKDNPFALATLVTFEKEMAELERYFQRTMDEVNVLLNKLSAQGIVIGVYVSDTPLNLAVGNVRLYGFKLIKLLTDYDLYVRTLKTLTLKGLMANKDANESLNEGGRRFRRVLNDLYQRVMRIRAVKTFNRQTLLNEETLSKLTVAVEQNVLPALPESVLRYKQLPELLYMTESLSDEVVDLIVSNANSANILAEVE